MNDFTDNDDDMFTGKEHTPLRPDAFDKTPAEKIEIIQNHFHQIMETLGMDMTDDSLKDSPKRVAKMFVNEIFGGLLPENSLVFLLFQTNTNTAKCWWKKISPFTHFANITFYLLLVELTLLTFPMEK